MLFLCGEKGGEKHVRCFKNVGVGLGGGNGTRKVGAGGRSGGSGEEYDEQDGGQVRRIEEGDKKGGKGADSSEDVGGMAVSAGKSIFDKSHVSHLCITKAIIFERRQELTLMCKSAFKCECMPNISPSTSSLVATTESEDRHAAEEWLHFGESCLVWERGRVEDLNRIGGISADNHSNDQ